MNLDNYIEKMSKCSNEEEKTSAINTFLNAQTKEERTAFLMEMSNKVDAIKSRLIEMKELKDTVITVKDYCDARKVSRQYVYQEIKKGKFKTIELPVFTEYQGKRIEVGHQKFLSF
jgi:hypothetical protein